MNNIQKNFQKLNKNIKKIAEQYNRKNKEILLLVATKGQTINTINNIINMQQKDFGENYVQEGIKKIEHFKNTTKNNKLIWHFIGSIQSNKTNQIAKYFDWCHTIDNIYVANRLNKQRPLSLPPLNVLIQINIDYETTKAGIYKNELINFSKKIKLFPRLNLRGIMCIPKYEKNFDKQLITFKKMQKLFQMLKNTIQNIDTLSLGMSDDMEAAIASGSTLIRIGKAIFKKNNINITNDINISNH